MEPDPNSLRQRGFQTAKPSAAALLARAAAESEDAGASSPRGEATEPVATLRSAMKPASPRKHLEGTDIWFAQLRNIIDLPPSLFSLDRVSLHAKLLCGVVPKFVVGLDCLHVLGRARRSASDAERGDARWCEAASRERRAAGAGALCPVHLDD